MLVARPVAGSIRISRGSDAASAIARSEPATESYVIAWSKESSAVVPISVTAAVAGSMETKWFPMTPYIAGAVTSTGQGTIVPSTVNPSSATFTLSAALTVIRTGSLTLWIGGTAVTTTVGRIPSSPTARKLVVAVAMGNSTSWATAVATNNPSQSGTNVPTFWRFNGTESPSTLRESDVTASVLVTATERVTGCPTAAIEGSAATDTRSSVGVVGRAVKASRSVAVFPEVSMAMASGTYGPGARGR